MKLEKHTQTKSITYLKSKGFLVFPLIFGAFRYAPEVACFIPKKKGKAGLVVLKFKRQKMYKIKPGQHKMKELIEKILRYEHYFIYSFDEILKLFP